MRPLRLWLWLLKRSLHLIRVLLHTLGLLLQAADHLCDWIGREKRIDNLLQGPRIHHVIQSYPLPSPSSFSVGILPIHAPLLHQVLEQPRGHQAVFVSWRRLRPLNPFRWPEAVIGGHSGINNSQP